MLTEVNDIGGEVSEAKAQEVLEMVSNLSKQSNVVVFSGGLPKGIDETYYGKLVRAADAKAIKIADASSTRMLYAVEEGVDLVKPNLDELEHVLGRCISDKQDMLRACYELLDRGAKRVLLSLGKQGAVITDGTYNYYCKSINVAVNSTVGAGDGMVAAAAMTLEKGGCLQEVLRAGVAAGTATVMTTGQTSFAKEKYCEVFDTLQIRQI
jgi:1-phosphofructokinase family hexose kinase